MSALQYRFTIKDANYFWANLKDARFFIVIPASYNFAISEKPENIKTYISSRHLLKNQTT